MAEILERITALLSQDKRLNLDGNLQINKLLELTLKLDEELIMLLAGDNEIKQHFFKELNNVLLFDQQQFISFINNKQFLPDSYTAVKHKIGLTAGEEPIRDEQEVVLVWPYKDYVLEGGQDKEDAHRTEIFYSQTLAPDEIDRLMEPKLFTNFKRYHSNGIEENPVFTDISADNLIIKGDNLQAMASIVDKYRGQVKLIYIDPPYNTENDSFGYNDSFKHSTWLTFMKNRLELAKQFLSRDGAIFIQIGDKEQAYLKVLCDEIFGRGNFKESIAVKNGSESGVNAINVKRGEQLFKVKEHILYYAKDALQHRFNPIYVRAMAYNYSYRLEVTNDNDEYLIIDVYKKILQQNFGQETLHGLTEEKKQEFMLKFEKYCLDNCDNIYALKADIQKSGEAFRAFAKENKNKGIVEKFTTADERTILVYQGGMLTSLRERIVVEKGKKYYGTLISDFWWDIGATPATEGGVKFKNGKKSEKLLKRIIKLGTNKGELVLDFFLGSGTTAAVAHKMGRRYIGIEQLDYNENDSVARLVNVISGDKSGISDDGDICWQGGGSFVYCELKK